MVEDTLRKLQAQKTGSHKIVQVQPKTITFQENGIVDTVSNDGISIAQRRGEIWLPLPTAHELEETDVMNPRRAAAEAMKHTGKENEIDND